MSIIFDFKAIRQDAAALGIRAIGEDHLPKAAPESVECCDPIPCTTSPVPCPPAPVVSRGSLRGHPAAGSAGHQQQAAVGGMGSVEVAPPSPCGSAGQQQQAAARGLSSAAPRQDVYRLNIPEAVDVDLSAPGHITYNPPASPPQQLLSLAPVTIEDLLRLSDEDFGKLVDRIDPGRLKHLLARDDIDEDDDF